MYQSSHINKIKTNLREFGTENKRLKPESVFIKSLFHLYISIKNHLQNW